MLPGMAAEESCADPWPWHRVDISLFRYSPAATCAIWRHAERPAHRWQRVVTVSIPIEVLEAEVLRLPQVERARLLDRVVASLDADKARDEAWERLAAKRDAELESGASSPVSGPEAIARLRAELL
jgi:hypothetical protein